MNEPPTAASDGDDGCTATAAALVGRRLFVANAGDSRAVLCRGGKGAEGLERRGKSVVVAEEEAKGWQPALTVPDLLP